VLQEEYGDQIEIEVEINRVVGDKIMDELYRLT